MSRRHPNRRRPVDECTVPDCERKRLTNSDLTCPAHWKMVPRAMKKALWKAQAQRSLTKREWDTIVAAEAIVDFLDRKKILLPPEPKLATGGLIETPDGLSTPDSTKRIITSSR